MASAEICHIEKIKFYISLDKLSDLELKEIDVPGGMWKITFLRAQNLNTFNVLVTNLNTNNNENSTDWACVATISIKLIRAMNMEKAHNLHIGPIVFNAKTKVWSGESLISWNDLFNDDNGYVQNNSCKLEIEIVSGPIQNENSGEWMKFQPIEKCCDKSVDGKFRLIINRLDESKQLCSPEIYLDNVPWRILVRKTNEQLQVSLRKIDLAYNSSRPKKFIVNLKSYDAKIAGLTKITNIDGSQAMSLITDIFAAPWTDVADPNKKYIENGSINIDVEMKMNNQETQNETENIDLNCPICKQSMIKKSIAVPHCGHMFCDNCVASERVYTCPVCKSHFQGSQLRTVQLRFKSK